MVLLETLGRFGVPLTPNGGEGILMPKLKYRFRVTLSNYGEIGYSKEFTRQVVTCGRPSIQHNSTALHSYNNIMYIPQKPEWSTIEITLRDDITNNATQLTAAQVQKQMNHFDQTSGVSGFDYKFTALIETLDGGNDNVFETWFLEGCYLETVAYDSMDYSSSEPVMLTLTVRYDNATQDVDTIMPLDTPPGVDQGSAFAG
jgi:hypothetical protein